MTVLVTGAEGYLGSRIAGELLAAGQEVVLWVRTRGGELPTEREQRLRAKWESWHGRVQIAGGDLTDADPFAGVDPSSVARIVHAAAVTRFNVDAETAQAVNVVGTRRLLDFARRCPRLQLVALLSTIYASGLREGAIPEAPLEETAFANEYERSKLAAEREAMASGLPWRVLRVATVLCDDERGHVGQYNAVHNTLQLMFYGLISTLPGRPDTPVYLVTGDMVARAVVRLLDPELPERVYHLAHRRQQSVTLAELLGRCWEAFSEDEGFRRRRLLRPLYLDEAGFETLAEALTTFSAGPVGQAVASMAPFARQLFVAKDVRNDNLVAALGSDPAPDAAALVGATARELVRTRWGREASRA